MTKTPRGSNPLQKEITDIQFEIIVHMLNENPKLIDRLRIYLDTKPEGR